MSRESITMKKNETQPKQDAQTEWLPEGVFDLHPHPLNEEQKKHILLVAGGKTHKNRYDFIRQIEIILGGFHARKEFYSRTTPSKVRAKFAKLQKHASLIMDTIQDLDEYSEQLLSKYGRDPSWYRSKIEKLSDGIINVGVNTEMCKGFTFEEASVAITVIYNHAGFALEETKNYTKNRLKRLAHQSLAYEIAHALRDYLNINPTTNPDGPFANVLTAVLYYAGDETKEGINIKNRDVRDLVKKALNDLKAES